MRDATTAIRIPAAQPANAVVYHCLVGLQPGQRQIRASNTSNSRNTNAYAVDVSGWRLTGAITFTCAPGTVIPAGKSLYLAANINAFRARAPSPHAGQNITCRGRSADS